MIPTWLKAQLEDRGLWNGDGINRRAKVRRHTCGAHVVAGLDDPRCAIPVIADTVPLSALGEALALVAGRSTYALRRGAGAAEIDHRSQAHIKGSPAGTAGYDVVAEHRCLDHSLDPFAIDTSYPPAPAKETHDEPPY